MSARVPLLVALTALAMLGPAGSALGRPPTPADVRVSGGEETWHATNLFRLDWDNPDTGFSLPVVDVGYLIRNPSGAVIAESHLGWAAEVIDSLRVPGPPGAYTLELWLEDIVATGNHVTVSLRYDDTRPPPAAARAPAGWIGRSDFPYLVEVEHPLGGLPVSGIRGYAISIERASDGRPCSDPILCTDTETDLRGGIGDDTLAVPELPEGESHVHVVAVSGSGISSAAIGDTVLRVDRTDPVTRLVGAPDGWTNRPVPITVNATDQASGMDAEGAFTAVQVDGGTPTISPGDSVGTTIIGDGAHRISRYARDAAGNVNDGATRNGVVNFAPAFSMVRIDRGQPEVGFINTQEPADPELIRVRVVDPMAGPSRSRGSIEIRTLGSGDRFQALPTQVVSGGLRARWDSEAYPPGRYEFRATGYDAAGNATATGKRLDGTPMVLANPLKSRTTLELGFGGETLVWQHCARHDGGRRCRRETVTGFARRPQGRVVPFGRGTLVSGRLITEAGTPVAGAPVNVAERLGRGPAGSVRIAVVQTDAAGRFSIRLAEGPSREISASFNGSKTLTRSAAAPLRLGVRSRVRLRVSSSTARVGGRPVVFRGRLIAAAGEIPAQGKALSLQFRLPGVPWTEFRTVRTDRPGRFRYAYRFSDDDSRGARFQFRAYAPAQSDWPYEPGSSGPVAVLGI